jgi:Flp pilus assembly protein TadG
VIVELAVMLPLLLAFLLGIIDLGWVLTRRQDLIEAAREGARFLVKKNITTTQAQNEALNLLPTDLASAATITATETVADREVKVTVSVPLTNLTLLGDPLKLLGATLSGKNVEVSVVMRKESDIIAP